MSDSHPPDDDRAFEAAVRRYLETRAERAAATAPPFDVVLADLDRRSAQRRNAWISRLALAAGGLLAVLIVAWLLVTTVPRDRGGAASPSAPPSAAGWAVLRRPLHLPVLAAGAPCPISPRQSVAPGLRPVPGAGPVYPLALTDHGTVYYDLAPDRNPQGAVVDWIAAPGIHGPVLVRGARLDGAGTLGFGVGDFPELEIPAFAEAEPLGATGWTTLETDLTVIPGPGCYAYQVDGPTFSTVVVFAARPVPELIATLHRPLRLPTVATGAACPTTPPRAVASWVGPAIGPGPVYSIGYGADGVLHYAGSAAAGGWRYAKVLWLAAPSAVGPILVRGRQLDGPGTVGFGDGATPAPDLLLSDTSNIVGVPGSSPGWRNFVAYTRIRGPGCYAYQIDTVAGSEVVVFGAAP